MLTEREDREHRELRRMRRQRQRLEEGDAYNSDGDSDDKTVNVIDEESYDDETD